MGGTIEACCLQPIDVIKTRLQLDKAGKYKGEGGRAVCLWVALGFGGRGGEGGEASFPIGSAYQGELK
jgi:hypothetical protein